MSQNVAKERQARVHRKRLREQRLSPWLLVSRRWWWKSLLVLLGMVVCVRLAMWQMDRLEQRKTRNAETRLLLASPPMDLNAEALPEDPSVLRYRKAVARGSYDFSQQVALEPQNWNGIAGLHLLAPLILEGGQAAVLVDRGWIPFEDLATDRWPQFDEPGVLTIAGTLQTSQKLPGGTAGPQTNWYRVDLAAIQAQMPYTLLPAYVVQSPDAAGNQALPYRLEPQIDLSDGSHLGYAVQWLLLALILGVGYVWFVGSQESMTES